ncbi:flagellar hook-length control protein FliK [Halalkalibacterium ligniniphilum]|uniref:flagellar hook-length control protein FliK n=1 Tax=Halalkalibacterium ligniniphilum TaxID=1134413 RepID=UPI000349AEA7|nr:flagellar hook-length control protein FliK [Halalkalibacterium ligniniphilum]
MIPAMMFLQNAGSKALMTTPASKAQLAEQAQSNTEFTHLLGELLSSEEGLQFQGLPLNGLPMLLTNEVETEEGLQAFYDLLNEWAYTSGDVLANDTVKEMLAQLPIEWQLNIEAMLQQKEPFTSEQFQQVGMEEGVLAAFFVLLQRQNQQTFIQGGAFQEVQQEMIKQLEKTFPFLRGQSEQSFEKLAKHWMEQVKELSEKAPSLKSDVASFLEAIRGATGREEAKTGFPFRFIPLETDGRPQQGLQLTQNGQELGQALSRTQQQVIHLGEQQPKEVQQQQFLRQFQQILQRGTFTQLQNGASQLTVKLYPEHLGRLDILLTKVGGAIVAKIMTSTQMSKELLESQLHQLRHAFTQQQLNVDRVEVTQQQQWLQQQGKEQQQQQQREQRRHDQQQEQEERATFREFLEELTFDEQV